MENLATKRSRSIVRTDQLPWGVSGEEGGVRPAGVTCSLVLAPAWSHRPDTHQPSARLWCPSPCPPRTHPRGMRAESSGAFTWPGPLCAPPPSQHSSPHLLAALGRIQHEPAAVGSPAQPRQSAAVDAREGACNESDGSQHPLLPPTATPRGVLTPCLPWHGLQHCAGVLGVPVVLWETWHGVSFAGSQPTRPCRSLGRGHHCPPARPCPGTGTPPPPQCPPPMPLTMRRRLHCWWGPRASFSR